MKIEPHGTFEESMAPIRNLAWLLCSSSHLDAQDAVPDISDQSSIFTLPCLGYLDDPDEGRTAFLYQLPRAGDLQPFTDIITLHDRINDPCRTTGYLPTAKPPLGSRFFLAHALASKMFDIHTFGWVHKNISSRRIIVYPSADHSSSSGGLRLVPYLAGWGYARNIDGRTVLTNDDDTEAEPNFYRHPLRQGRPRNSFKPEHDIYSLGVVLLEIALWRTISSIFKQEIDKVASSRKLPEPERIRKALLDRARDDIPREMGESYARAVERCLLGDFGTQGDDQKQTKLSVSFRELVIDAVAAGSKL